MLYILYISIGFIGGGLAGLLGIGGGVVYTLILEHTLPNYGATPQSLAQLVIRCYVFFLPP